jgi:hypothetical protein
MSTRHVFRWLFAGLSSAVLFLAGCTGRDTRAKERAEFMGSELALNKLFPGAFDVQGVDDVVTKPGTGDFRGPVTGGGSQILYKLPLGTDLNELTDFYLTMFAKQGHKNIAYLCTVPGSRSLWAARWAGKVGYVISVDFYKPEPVMGREPTFVGINLNIGSTKKMRPPTEEDPAWSCPFYALERMAKVLLPFGLVPFAAPSTYRWPYTFDGGVRPSLVPRDPPHISKKS